MPARLLLFAALAVAAFAACARPRPGVGESLGTGRLAAHLARLDLSPEGPDAERRLAYAAEQLAAARLQPALHGSFVVPSGSEAAYVLGYLAGRDPNISAELVLLVGTDGPGAAAVLEAARLLAQDARTTLTPERTVGVAVWGPRGAAAFLAHPPWALDRVARVLLVAEDSLRAAPGREAWDRHGVPVFWVTPPEEHRSAGQPALAHGLTLAAYRAARAATASSSSATASGPLGPFAR
jgi:hypothetical protein